MRVFDLRHHRKGGRRRGAEGCHFGRVWHHKWWEPDGLLRVWGASWMKVVQSRAV